MQRAGRPTARLRRLVAVATSGMTFLSRRTHHGWDLPQIRLFAPEYFHWVSAFPRVLASLVANASDDDTRSFLAEILFQELGEGDARRRHSLLFRDLLRALGMSLDEIEAGPHFDETKRLVAGMAALYREPNMAKALGAQYGLEHQAVPMIRRLYRGMRHLERPGVDFSYFHVHLAAEPRHARLMTACLGRYVTTPKHADDAAEGATRLLGLIAGFWRRIERETARR